MTHCRKYDILKVSQSRLGFLVLAVLVTIALNVSELFADDNTPNVTNGADVAGGNEVNLVDSDGDLIPDSRDPMPFVANIPVYWSIQKVSLSRLADVESADSSWSHASALDIAVALPVPADQSKLTIMPYAKRKAVGDLKCHPFAMLGVFGSDNIAWGNLQRFRVRRFKEGCEAGGYSVPVTISFSVHFFSLFNRNQRFGALEVPVKLDGKVCAIARPSDKNASEKGMILPADGKTYSVEFSAEIPADETENFLTRLSKAQESPVFEFESAQGLDVEEEPGVPSLSAIFASVKKNTKKISISGPEGMQWRWHVAPVSLADNMPVTFGFWADGMNNVSQKLFNYPLFAFDGIFPISVFGWDMGHWDLWWSVTRKSRSIDLESVCGLPLSADIALSLVREVPRKAPAAGTSPITAFVRAAVNWKKEHIDESLSDFATAGRDGAPQGYNWYGYCKSLQKDEEGAEGANAADAARFYKLAAEAGYAPGLAWYGKSLILGNGLKENKKLGLEFLRKSADQGFAEGEALYALFLKKGVGCKAEPEEAVKRLIDTAWKGSDTAQFGLGVHLLEERSHEGLDWLQLAAEEGNAKAQSRLASFIREGELGTQSDLKTAAKWYALAAENGDVPAMVALGEAYRSGSGVRQNDRTAAKYFKMAAESGSLEGKTWYATFLLEGRGVRRNVGEAIDLMKKAADAGYSNAQYLLGVCLLGGYGGIEKNSKDGFRYLSAASNDQIAAKIFVGYCWMNGIGTEKNEQKAVASFKAAADKNIPVGQIWLAYCYMNGIGVKKDIEIARKWAKAAADSGAPAGRQMLLSIQE